MTLVLLAVVLAQGQLDLAARAGHEVGQIADARHRRGLAQDRPRRSALEIMFSMLAIDMRTLTPDC